MNGDETSIHLGPSPATVEAEKYATLWADAAYRESSPGERFADLFVEVAAPAPASTVLDLGAGAGAGGVALAARGLEVTLADLVDAERVPGAEDLPLVEHCAWQPLAARFDYVYCCDVLEHLPPELTLLAAYHAISAARRGAFFSVGLTEDACGVLVGGELHLTVRPHTWWRDHLAEVARGLGTLVEARDLLTTGVYHVAR